MICVYLLVILIKLAAGLTDSHHLQCGRPTLPFHDNKVVGGTASRRGAWPWMAMLTELAEQVCGGTLITEQVVVTAAHCFEEDPSQDVGRWRAIFGNLYAPLTTDPFWPSSRIQYRQISKLIMHEAYDNESITNDIALLILSNKVHFNEFVLPACLPHRHHTAQFGEVCYATGWGDTQGTGNETVLNQVDLKIINNTQCSQQDWLGDDFLPVSTLCAGFEIGQKDTCAGDSGGPLVCKYNGAWFLQGISSWGFKCAVPKWPGVYTNVSEYTHWIHEKLFAEGLHSQINNLY